MKFLNNRFVAVFLPIAFLILSGCARPGSKEFSDAVVKVIEENPKKVFEILTKHAQEEAMSQRQDSAKQEQAALEEQFKNPLKPVVDNRPIRGPKNAPVTIVEYSDFQCPYCSRGFSTVTEVMKNYPGKVRLVYKHLPLDFHPEALPAAKATVAAGNQGKFYEFHDELFKNQQKLGKDLYVATAKKLKLDVEKFKKDLESPATLKIIEEDKQEAQQFQMSGTPGFIINGVALKGAYPYEMFKTIIDRHLAKP